MVQLRAFGDFRYRLKDPETFINQFVGTFGAATSAEIEDRIKGELVKQLNVTLGKMKANGLKVVDFAASLNDIEQGVLANAKPHFLTLGIEILQISGLNIPLPDSIKEALEKMASAKVLGRTNAAAYQQFAFADSMKAAAANPSGTAGTGVGLGAGIGMGYAMGSQMGGMVAQPPQQQQMRACPKCGTMNPANVKFCGNCGADTTVAAILLAAIFGYILFLATGLRIDERLWWTGLASMIFALGFYFLFAVTHDRKVARPLAGGFFVIGAGSFYGSIFTGGASDLGKLLYLILLSVLVVIVLAAIFVMARDAERDANRKAQRKHIPQARRGPDGLEDVRGEA